MERTNTLFEVKNFLSAETPDLLVEAQLENNFKFGLKFKYDVLFDGKKWYAWFEQKVDREVVNDAKK